MNYKEKYEKILKMKEDNTEELLCKSSKLKELLNEISKNNKEEDLINKIKYEILMLRNKCTYKENYNIDIILKDLEIEPIINKIKDENSLIEFSKLLDIFSGMIYGKDQLDVILKEKIKHSTIISSKEQILDSHFRVVAVLDNISNEDIFLKNKNYNDHLIYILSECLLSLSVVLNIVINSYVVRHKDKIELDLREILKDSAFIKPENFESYIKMFCLYLIDNDIETALQKCIPLLENSLKYICEINGISPYRLKNSKNDLEKTIDETNMFGYILNNLLKDIIPEDIVFNLLALFDSVIGFNIRNNISHGLWDSDDYDTTINHYALFFILFLCCRLKKVNT